MNTLAETTSRATMGGKPVFTVPSKTVLNLDSGFRKKLLCDGPTFTAGTACAYSCSFCFVPDAMRKQAPWLKKHGVSGDHMDVVIRRENAVELLRKQLAAPKARTLADKPLVIYASPLVDVAANMELCRETAEMCRVILTQTNWDIRLLSKSNLLPKIAEMLGEANLEANYFTQRTNRERVIYGVSTGTLDDRLAKAFEEGTPLVSKRLASLHWLQDHGFRTFGMICPSLPMPGWRIWAWARDVREAIRADKCEHVWAEVINVRGESFTRTIAALREGGFHNEADQIVRVSDPGEWENYARLTFEAHAAAGYRTGQLRFLQYVNNSNRAWWQAREKDGAILL